MTATLRRVILGSLLALPGIASSAIAQSTAPALVKDLVPGSSSSNPSALMSSEHYVFFSTSSAGRFYRTDGSPSGTVEISDVSFASSDWALYDSQVYFAAHDGMGDDLWRVNAAADGTERVNVITRFGGIEPRQLTSALGLLFFSAIDDEAGRELWVSDGTAEGTARLADLVVGGSSDPRQFTEFGGHLYFVATDGAGVARLWRTDGTAAGTLQVTTVPVGKAPFAPPMLIPYGNSLYFSGSSAGGTELWQTDGTSHGTILVADIEPGSGSSFPFSPKVAGGRLYFAASTAALGAELYRIDTAGSGPILVADLNPGTGSSFPFPVIELGEALILSAHQRLWSVEGEVVTPLLDSGTSTAVRVGRFAYFMNSSPLSTGHELYVTDGTAEGTRLVHDLVSGTGSSFPGGLTVLGTTLFFTATTPSTGKELWRAGTCETTVEASGPTSFCQGGSVTLTASSGSGWLWSNGSTTRSITVDTTGSYSVTATQPDGCGVTSEPVMVTVLAPPAATITPSGPTTFCEGGTVTLTASSASAYQWSDGSTTPSIVVGTAGTFSVTLTDANGCNATSTPTTVTVNPLPVASITSSGPTTFCEGGSVILTTSPAASYLWSNGATTQSITVTTAGSYAATLTSEDGCSATSAAVTVTVKTATIVIEQPDSLTIPKNTSTTLSVGAAGEGTLTYQWYRGTSGDSSRPVAGATSPQFETGRLTKNTYHYWVKVTGDCGPANSTTATIVAQ